MSDIDTESKLNKSLHEAYAESGNVEAHIIADMLRIEGITRELREFKTDTKASLGKLEGYIVGIIAVTVATLISSVGGLIYIVIT